MNRSLVVFGISYCPSDGEVMLYPSPGRKNPVDLRPLFGEDFGSMPFLGGVALGFPGRLASGFPGRFFLISDIAVILGISVIERLINILNLNNNLAIIIVH